MTQSIIEFAVEHGCCVTFKSKGNDKIHMIITHPKLEDPLNTRFDINDTIEMATRPKRLMDEMITRIY